MKISRKHRGFSLIELLVVIAIIAVLVSLLLPAINKARRLARMTLCMSNMSQLGRAMGNYASDAKGSIGSFSWNVGISNSQFADLQGTKNTLQAHNNQAVDIIRRLRYPSMPSVSADNYSVMDGPFTYLALLDGGYFADGRLPAPGVACPEDRDLTVWSNYGANPNRLGDPRQTGPSDVKPAAADIIQYAVPFRSSYLMVPYGFWRDGPKTGNSNVIIRQYGAYSAYTYSGTGSWSFNFQRPQRRQEEVDFPSQKVMFYDFFDRHAYKRTIFYAYTVAAQPLAFFDGSVSMRKTKDANAGWDPSNPTSKNSTTIVYSRQSELDPLPLSGKASGDRLNGYYRWTRSGLKGIDFGGGEVQWAP